MAPRNKKKVVGEVAPNWKVLKMKLKENDSPSTSSKGLKSVRKRTTLHNQESKWKKKFAEEIPITGSVDETGQVTHVVALDCEYVGVGMEGKDDALARVSIVNGEGMVVYDKYVRPKERVTDFRTHVSGIRPANLVDAERFEAVQLEVNNLLRERIVVGHALHNDFRVLGLTHPRKLTRDTSKCAFLRSQLPVRTNNPSLKMMAMHFLGIDIQEGEHNSIVDARVALRIYLSVRKKWEDEIKRFRP